MPRTAEIEVAIDTLLEAGVTVCVGHEPAEDRDVPLRAWAYLPGHADGLQLPIYVCKHCRCLYCPES